MTKNAIPRLSGAVSALALCLALAAPAAAQSTTKLRIAGPAPVLSATDSIIWYAVPTQLGYYKDEGLEVTYNLSPGMTASAQALQSGSVEIAVTNPEVVMQVREQGGALTVFQTLRRSNGNTVNVLPDSPIKTLPDLKGKTLGGVSWGAGGALYLTKVLTDLGIGMGDYSRVVTGNGAAAAAALRSKQVDALVLWDSAYAGIENTGVKMRYIPITDQEKLGSNSIAVTDAFLKSNEATVAKFCRAIAKSYYFARVSPEAAVLAFLKTNPGFKPANVALADAVRDNLHIFEAYLNGATNGLPIDAPVGAIEPDIWAFNQNFYKSTGMLKGTYQPDASYTTKFTERCNGFDRAAVAQAAKSYKP
jgi:NitT/TauT family transport system substrate-binding protein